MCCFSEAAPDEMKRREEAEKSGFIPAEEMDRNDLGKYAQLKHSWTRRMQNPDRIHGIKNGAFPRCGKLHDGGRRLIIRVCLPVLRYIHICPQYNARCSSGSHRPSEISLVQSTDSRLTVLLRPT